jgi:hypothetical protein
LQGSFLITSGAIHATVPAKLILVLISFHCLHVPKSLILITSSWPINTLHEKKRVKTKINKLAI